MEWAAWRGSKCPISERKKKEKKIPTFGKPLLERTLKNVLKIVEPDQKPEGGRYGEWDWNSLKPKAEVYITPVCVHGSYYVLQEACDPKTENEPID